MSDTEAEKTVEALRNDLFAEQQRAKKTQDALREAHWDDLQKAWMINDEAMRRARHG